MLAGAATGLLVFAMHAGAAETSGELLVRIRQRMADNLARLPNYTCRETIERKARPAGLQHLALIDRLRLEVAYVSEKELYSWPGVGKFEEKSIEQIVGRGPAISTGNFALQARAVFRTNAPEFSWGGEGEENGRKTVRFNFRVSREKSGYAIQTGPAPIFVAYHGFIEADAGTLALLRLEVRADELPPELKLYSAGEATQYAPMRIGGTEFLLPFLSELSMVEMTGDESRNVTRFEACRQYAAVSTLRFNVVEKDAGGAQPAGAIELPGGLRLESRLRDTIDSAKAARGDLVYATVPADVRRSGVVIIPKGAVLTGRITRLENHTVRSAVYLGVGLLFHTIEFGGRRGVFSGELEEAGIGPDYFVRHDGQPSEDLVYVKVHAQRLVAGTRLVLRTK